MPLDIVPFDATEFFDTEEAQKHLVQDAFESGNPSYIASALGIVAKARGMSQVARDSGVSREALYKSLTEGGDPKTSTLISVAKALGYLVVVKDSEDKPTVRKRSQPRRKRVPVRRIGAKAA